MLTTIAIVLVILWVLGLLGNVAGGIIHLLLVIALVIFLYDVLVGRRRV